MVGQCAPQGSSRRNPTPIVAADRKYPRRELMQDRNTIAGHSNVATPGVLEGQTAEGREYLPQDAASPGHVSCFSGTAKGADASDNHASVAVKTKRSQNTSRVPYALSQGQDAADQLGIDRLRCNIEVGKPHLLLRDRKRFRPPVGIGCYDYAFRCDGSGGRMEQPSFAAPLVTGEWTIRIDPNRLAHRLRREAPDVCQRLNCASRGVE